MTYFRKILILGGLGLMISCSSNPYRTTNKVYKKKAKAYAKELSRFPLEETQTDSALNFGEYPVGTTNFNLRRPNFVVIHHTAQDSTIQTLNTFTIPRTSVSSHYVIGDDGEVFHMLNNYYRAWHGGIGQWGHTTDLNSSSIGIELDNNGKEVFSEAQISSLLDVLKQLKEDYKIPAENFIGHLDIAPGRKVDPSADFPWKRLAEEGYGIWYDEDSIENIQFEHEFFTENQLKIDKISPVFEQRIALLDRYLFNNVIPADFNIAEALRIIGYNINDLDAAIKSFQIHFLQEKENVDGILNAEEIKILYNLYRKSL
ncbi:N-acetylmuramoyl-L-alanine amidase [Zunongwangia sp. SCSIO 43204]|uniref:N-acetylmuramoyl-L-alanine amidase n=1 Tax=Zunongwangia sp. SCSIO 43204 TaxID=2779359 RepID=UPI001CA976DD|nr:N-acetylmuramoyl-L-alanine amidase [Zunongwangia sp. SCSIO 43204]UAB85243.1 N-acetylmuramoyl-L-alanine amidase [Zunongwangia sp. SCSIO 43204]